MKILCFVCILNKFNFIFLNSSTFRSTKTANVEEEKKLERLQKDIRDLKATLEAKEVKLSEFQDSLTYAKTDLNNKFDSLNDTRFQSLLESKGKIQNQLRLAKNAYAHISDNGKNLTVFGSLALRIK